MNRTGLLIFAWLLTALVLLLLSGLAQPALAQTMPPTSTADRLKPPPTVYPPTQADEGHQVYHMVCMACHGDRGQGLTDEWRAALDVGDQNCWQSGCHNTRRPPEGFIFPKTVPRVVGGGALARFETALDLHDYLVEKMPYQNPGYLKSEEYWQLTAFLLRENGVKLPNLPLNAETAAQLRLRMADSNDTTPVNPDSRANLWFYFGVGLLAATALGWMFFRRRFR